jgi:cation:H+ antiporter
MSLILNLSLILVLFAVLGWSADLAVKNIRLVALTLRMKLFALGIILGVMTTLPELSVCINAALNDAGSLSVGNIMGGMVVLIGLILGVSLIANKKVATDDINASLIPSSLVILSPFILGIDGRLAIFDGLIMITLYLALIFWLYRNNKNREPLNFVGLVDRRRATKEVLFAILGVILVMLTSSWIVDLTMVLLDKVLMSKLLIGLILFSIGTNLPEIIIAVTTWRHKNPDLSLFHLVSSAFSSILVLGLLSILKPITFSIGPVYYALAFFVSLIIIVFIIFSHTHKSLSRLEGFILLTIYLLFLATNIYLALL